MRETTQKPVIFLAFAQDRVEGGRYLCSLPIELDGIRKALQKARQAELCEVVERPNTILEHILDVFQEYKDRITIFHYGGHANSYALLLETLAGEHAIAHGKGLLSFLSKQKGLQLIFLNGCCSQQHAFDLIEAGLPAVIGTSQKINDEVATILSVRFYKGLAAGASIDRAWAEAVDEVKIAKGATNFRDLYGEGMEEAEDRFPWDIYYRPGAEVVKEWNLPKAANHPLFGLPEIPKTYYRNLLPTPFIGLHYFKKEDAAIFFGRGAEIRQLYNHITGISPLILFYGKSGVGKSSLLDAGLIPRIEEKYTVQYIRRIQEKGLTGTLMQALQKVGAEHGLIFMEAAKKNEIRDQIEELQKALAGSTGAVRRGLENELQQLTATETLTLLDYWRRIEEKTGQPLIIILDQAEEKFTRPLPDDKKSKDKKSKDELVVFLETVHDIFDQKNKPPEGKLVLSYRKEYHPEIRDAILALSLPYSEVFLQPLGREGIIEAVEGLTRHTHTQTKYHLEIDEKNQEGYLPEIIADDLLKDKESPVAPMLQIILTKLWNAAIKDNPEAPRFSIKQYQEFENAGITMHEFFQQQMEQLRQWQPEVVDSGLALDVLHFHTTTLGTAANCASETLQAAYQHRQDVIDQLLEKCKTLYLLTDIQVHQENTVKPGTSLAHDTLAPVVISQYNNSDRPGQRATRILSSKMIDFRKNENSVWLDEADLSAVEQGASGMRAWKQERLIEASRRNHDWNQRRIKETQLTAEAQAVRTSYPQRSLLLAVEAANILRHAGKPHTAAAENALRAALAHTGGQVLAGQEYGITDLAISPNNQWLATVGVGGAVELWDLTATNPAAKPVNLAGHKQFIDVIAFSVDNHWLATGSRDNTARLWDLTANNPAANSIVLEGHKNFIKSIAISADNRWVVTGSEDSTARLWDLTAMDPAASSIVLKDHNGFINAVAISPNNHWLVTGSEDKTARLWDLTSNNPAANSIALEGHTGTIYAVATSPDNHWLVTGGNDKTARLWDLTAKNPATDPIVLDHENEITRVAFSPDNHWLVTITNRTAQLWDLTAANPAATKPVVMAGHNNFIRAVAISADSHWLATGSWDHTVRLWDLTANNPAINPVIFAGHDNYITAVAISGDNHWLVTASYNDNIARLWDLTAKNSAAYPVFLADHKDAAVKVVAISADNHWLVTGSEDKTARLWNLTAENPAANSVVLEGHKGFINAVAISVDNHWLVTGSEDKTARLWNLTAKNPAENPIVLSDHEETITAVAISADNHWLATGSKDKTARLWDLTANNLAANSIVLEGHKDVINAVAISPNNHWLATGSEDKTARLWDLTAKNPTVNPFVLASHESGINAIAFSPNNHWLVTGSGDGIARLWDLTAMNPAANPIVLTAHMVGITAMAISADSRWLVTCGDDPPTTRLWDLTANNPAANPIVLRGHEGFINDIALSADNHWLVTGGSDCTARLWDLTAKNPAANPVVLTGHEELITDVVISADNHWLVTGSRDGTARLWNLRLEELIDLACHTAGRNLTYPEWQQYFPGQPYCKTCPDLPIHPSFIEHGSDLAIAIDLDGAIKIFERAKELEPSLDLDPKAAAKRLAVRFLVDNGNHLARLGQIKEATASYEKAQKLDPTLQISAD